MASSLVCFIMFTCLLGMVKAEWQFSSVNINVSDSCKAGIHRLSELQVNDPQLMAYYWDSWGKPSDGILTGHTTFLGYYDECIDLKNTAVGETKYCIYSMNMETILTDTIDPSKDVCSSSECPTPLNVSSSIDIKVGICYPSQCSSTEFATVLSAMTVNNVVTMTTFPFSNKMISYAMMLRSNDDSLVFCPDVNVELDRGAIAVIIVCALLIGLVAVGTTVDFLLLLFSSNELTSDMKSRPENVTSNTIKGKFLKLQDSQLNMKDLIRAFSLYSTVPKLVSTKQSTSTIKGVNAIKNLLQLYYYIPPFTLLCCFYIPFSQPEQTTILRCCLFKIYFSADSKHYIFS